MPEILRVPIELRWSDTDQYGHVNNAAHIRYVEEARIRAFGLPDQPESANPELPRPVLADLEPGSFTIVAGQRIEYRTELPYAGQFVIAEVWLSRLGTSSFTMDCRLVDERGTTEYAVASVTIVLVDSATRRPRALSMVETRLLDRYVATGVAFR